MVDKHKRSNYDILRKSIAHKIGIKWRIRNKKKSKKNSALMSSEKAQKDSKSVMDVEKVFLKNSSRNF